MVNKDIFLGSGASLNLVPELDFKITSQSNPQTNDTSVQLNTATMGHFSLLTNLYEGSILEFYSSAGTANVAEITTLTLSSDTKTDYNGDYLIFTVLASNGNASTHAIWFDVAGGDSEPAPSANAGGSTEVTINDAGITTKEEIAALVANAIDAVSNVSAVRNGAVITITNAYGGANSAATTSSDSTNLTVVRTQQGGTITTTETLVSTHRVTSNTATTLNFTPAISEGTANHYFVLKAYGSPLPAPKSGSDKRLLADNWLGLLETGTFPNVEVEMKQMNLSLGGSRNWTYQYKGTENATGGSLAFVLTHPTWFYYFLGSCSLITGSGIIGTNNANVNANGLSTTNADTDNKFLIDSGAFLSQGPIIYRTVGDKVVPPLAKTDVNTAMDIVAVPTGSGTNDLLTYTFNEVEGDILPSFALEQSVSKLDGANQYKTGTDALEDNNFVRIARGNMVSDISLTANENEEVKMTMNLNTRNVSQPNTDAVYEARNGQATNTSLINYNTAKESYNEPYFYSGGSFSIFGQNFLKITSFTLNMNNGLEDKRFLGSQSKSIKDAIPSQRTYEISFTALITDNRLFNELLDNTDAGEQAAGTNNIVLTFAKQGNPNETFTITLTDYLLSSANVTIPDNKGAVTIEATVMPRNCASIVATTNWILQG